MHSANYGNETVFLGGDRNVGFLLDACRSTTEMDDLLTKKFGVGGIDRPQSNSFCPIHHAGMAFKLISKFHLSKFNQLNEHKERTKNPLNLLKE